MCSTRQNNRNSSLMGKMNKIWWRLFLISSTTALARPLSPRRLAWDVPALISELRGWWQSFAYL